MIEWPANLVRDIARRRVVIVIGSGVSRHSLGRDGLTRPPVWETFLERALADCPNKNDLTELDAAMAYKDFLNVCEWLKIRYDENWVKYLRKTFSFPAFAPSELHEQILQLDVSIVFSLNFDDIYERHANTVTHGSYITKHYCDDDVTEFLRGEGRYIIKVHGSLNTPQKLIFTQNEYAAARVKHSSFYEAFDAALLTHTFLFIGSGYSDPDVNLLLENQKFGFPTQNPHYFLSKTGMSAERKNSLRENRNLKVVEYDPVDDNHSGLVSEIKYLNEKVESERHDIGLNISW
jgi:hypothetical protein